MRNKTKQIKKNYTKNFGQEKMDCKRELCVWQSARDE